MSNSTISGTEFRSLILDKGVTDFRPYGRMVVTGGVSIGNGYSLPNPKQSDLVVIRKDFRLGSLIFEKMFETWGVMFLGAVSCDEAVFKRKFDMTNGIYYGGFYASRATFEQGLDADCSIVWTFSCGQALFVGVVQLGMAKFRENGGPAFQGDQATFKEGLLCEGAEFSGSLSCAEAVFEGDFDAGNGNVYCLLADRATFKAKFICRHKPRLFRGPSDN